MYGDKPDSANPLWGFGITCHLPGAMQKIAEGAYISVLAAIINDTLRPETNQHVKTSPFTSNYCNLRV